MYKNLQNLSSLNWNQHFFSILDSTIPLGFFYNEKNDNKIKSLPVIAPNAEFALKDINFVKVINL